MLLVLLAVLPLAPPVADDVQLTLVRPVFAEEEIGNTSDTVMPPRLVEPADRSQRQYCFIVVPRDLEVECFVCRSRVSRQGFESFQDRRRSRRKVEKDTSVS